MTAIVSGLQEIFIRQRQADRVVEQMLRSNSKWGARDRSYIAENTYEIVRWWRLILHLSETGGPPQPEQFWQLFGVWQLIKPVHLSGEPAAALPDWIEFSEINPSRVLSRYKQARKIRKIAQSIPDWLDETGIKELGPETWEAEITAMNRTAPLTLRVNTLLSDVPRVREIFGTDRTVTIPDLPTAVVLLKRQNVTQLPGFRMGFFEVQDAGSQLIAPFLGAEPGHTVIDACAGAGGKTLHLAALMQNKGRILSMDVDKHKLIELERRVHRNGVKIVRTALITSAKVIREHWETADRLLLDVPCSGLGVLRRNPDAKWKLKPEFLDSVRATQWKILSSYSKMVKKGGRMVYATCSILPSESEDQVARFLGAGGNAWRLISEKRTSVARDGHDGFYMAQLERF